MNRTKMVHGQLQNLVERLNKDLGVNLQLNQQKVTKEHMSISGANGRLWISPTQDGYDVSLSGKSLEKQMVPTLERFFNRQRDGYKQANSNTGIYTQPYWRTNDFKDVEQVAALYAKTKS